MKLGNLRPELIKQQKEIYIHIYYIYVLTFFVFYSCFFSLIIYDYDFECVVWIGFGFAFVLGYFDLANDNADAFDYFGIGKHEVNVSENSVDGDSLVKNELKSLVSMVIN